jgi:hypothetical protein
VDPQDSQENIKIGNENSKKAGEDCEANHTGKDFHVHLGVCTGCFYQWEHITEKVVNNITTTET